MLLLLAFGSAAGVQAMDHPDRDLVVQFYTAYKAGTLARFVTTFSAPALRKAVSCIEKTVIARADIMLSFNGATYEQIHEAVTMLTLVIHMTGNPEAMQLLEKILSLKKEKDEPEFVALYNTARTNPRIAHLFKDRPAKKYKSKL